MDDQRANALEVSPKKRPPLYALMERAVLVRGRQWGMNGGGPKQKGKTCVVFRGKRCYSVQNGGGAVVLRHLSRELSVCGDAKTDCCAV